jgi:hypothetical protein
VLIKSVLYFLLREDEVKESRIMGLSVEKLSAVAHDAQLLVESLLTQPTRESSVEYILLC